jgi:hypothetical protein
MKLSIVCVHLKKFELCIVGKLIDYWLTTGVFFALKQSVNHRKNSSLNDGDVL